MDLTLVERLICPEAHDTAPLVVRVDVVQAGRVQRGMLGCPVCRREWPVDEFLVRFGPRAPSPPSASIDGHAAAAFLDLTAPGIVIVDGVPGDVTSILSASYEAAVVAMDDKAGTPAAAIHGAQRVPLAPAVAAGALLFRQGRSADFVASLVNAVVPGGRVVAIRNVVADGRLREIAHDEHVSVFVREPDAVRVELARRGS
jgi:hypothetical protein